MGKVKSVRVLHIVGAMNRAGTETMLMNIYRNMNREKIQFDFVSYSHDDADYDQEIKKLGGKVIKLTKTTSVKAHYDVLKRYGPYDAVHSHTLFHCGIANTAAWLAGVKVRVAHAHTTLDDRSTFIRKMYITFMRFMINCFSNQLLACSVGAGQYLFGEGALCRRKYAYFPNVIDYTKFLKRPSTEVKKFKMEIELGNSIVIGHIGRFIEAKNHTFLLEIMKRVVKKDSSIKLLLIGDGDLRKSIEKRVKREGIHKNIRFTGIRTDINTMLHSMDIFVFPSLYEGLGLVLLEAQASGIPCVVSEAIQPEADIGLGLVTTLSLQEDPEIWAEEIMRITSKKEKNIKSVIEAFERSGYSLTEGIAKLMNIYQRNRGEEYEKNADHFL